ncbi:hypothetical protein [Aliarcobacter butzleri]|uniref:hypothetical protein n=1 Tax=Aliarcobacter butzleri TaxID=28197 RepID=UPI0021B28270|nr:hypothetical protein [Aliarcobacter butzleri]MCT7590451.1 hypothetical protein [Aliarcobacter butzleri]
MDLLFLQPYLAIATTGCYSLVQVLDILEFTNIDRAFNGSNIMHLFIGFYSLTMLSILLVSLIASFALSKKLFFFFLILYLTPGILQITGLYTFKAYIEPYSFIPLKIGNEYGILVNSFLVIIISWSLATISLHIFRAEKKFKNFFDHIWYLSGLTALVLFVMNYNNEFTKKESIDVQDILSKQINIAKKSLSDITIYCEEEIFSNTFPTICQWSKPAYTYVEKLDFFQNNINSFEEKSPSLEFILNISKTVNKEKMNLEFDKLNTLCDNKNIQDKCLNVPINFNKNQKFNIIQGVKEFYILPIKEIMPAIELKWQEASMLQKKEKIIKLFPYYQWVFFMFLSILIGIKIANSSRELFGGKLYSVYRANFKKFFISIIFFKCNNYYT